MTDNELNAIKLQIEKDLLFRYSKEDIYKMLLNAINLITRQKAEIERFEKVQTQYVKAWIDEFSERLKNDCSLAFVDGELLNKVID